ncbi:MAG TPA: TonB-dependent receptor plug domain-containing protein, partial [Wenzhouxiangellaceae bacterium]|nr:TonB-dependent receptor plug domain-containing protein [Wenzhouxiangellaceae bacterium]
MKSFLRVNFLVILMLQAPLVLHAAQPGAPDRRDSGEDTVIYPASFFSSYQPVSAIDMVRQVPGFRISNGDGSRGFAGAGGNVLINGERPSSKQDSVSSILARVPASRVERIELIRGNTGKYDAGSQSVIVNVILDV